MKKVEFHPYLYQKELLDFCKSSGIQLVAYSPLGSGSQSLLKESCIQKMAEKYNKTPAQVLLRWGLQHKVGTVLLLIPFTI